MLIRTTALVVLGALAGFAADSGSSVATVVKESVATAVKEQDSIALRALLQKKADVNAALSDGSTALHWAVENDDLETLDLLLQAGANPDAADHYGITPLYYASANGNAAIVERLLKAGANSNTTDKYGDTALMAAARAGNPESIKALLGHDAAVNAKDKNTQQSALMWAARSHHPVVEQLLLEHGAEANAGTRTGQAPAVRLPLDGGGPGGGSHGLGIVRGGWPERGVRDVIPGAMTALLYVARDGDLESVKVLVGAGADVNQGEADNVTPLLIAIGNAHFDVAGFLLDRGASVNTADWWGRTPLWFAIETRNRDSQSNNGGESGVGRPAAFELIKSLIARGADVNVRTKEYSPIRRWLNFVNDISWVDFTGQTPFIRAALAGDISVMRLLLDKGADPNIQTFSNSTALMAASGINWAYDQTYTESREHTMEAVQLCLEKGADVNAVNAMGLTAVMGAANRGLDDVVELLVKKGARLDVKDKQGRTPFIWAKGVYLATHMPEEKPSTMALIQKLMGSDVKAEVIRSNE
jgi:ankyrin repeat protein